MIPWTRRGARLLPALVVVAACGAPAPAGRSAGPADAGVGTAERDAADAGPGAAARPLTELERLAGWRDLLADGLDAWGAAGPPGPGWRLEGGVLALDAGGRGGDLLSRGVWEDLELRFAWRVSPGANSGVKYRVPPPPPGARARGAEYQVLDDARHPDGGSPLTSAAALYGVVAPTGKPPAPPGVWRRGRVLARGDLVRHELDGVQVVDARVGSPAWEAARRASKFADLPDLGRGPGHLVVQDHGDAVAFRDVHLRDLGAPPGVPVPLDLGPALAGWSRVGDARYTGDGTTITGEVTGGAQSFLVSGRTFGDVLVEVDVRLDVAANSGIQVRSAVDASGVLRGYQIEIDPSERAWSGGLYDEMGRGWLDDLADAPRARAAFGVDGWNRYRIECVGPWIRAWIDDVPAADHFDGTSLEGVLALQVHNGSAGRIRWRDLRVRDLGRHRWAPAARVEVTDGRPARETLAGSAGDASYRFTARGVGTLTLRRASGAGAGRELVLEATPGSAPAAGARSSAPPRVDGPARGRVLEVHAHGHRLAVVVDGTTLRDLEGLAAERAADWVLELRPAAAEGLVVDVERLVHEPP